MTTGFYDDLPAAAYHRRAETSKSDLDLIARTPAHYWAHKLAEDRLERRETPAMFLGTAIHTAVLEPELFDQTYAIVPADAPRRPSVAQRNAKKPSADTVAAIDWWAKWNADNGGRIMLTAEQRQACLRMQAAIRRHPVADYLLSDPGKSELSAIGHDDWMDEKTRCRFDRLNDDGVIIDLKKTVDASPRGFAKSAANYRYHVQQAFYSDVYQSITGMQPRAFLFIAVEEEEPHGVAVYRLADEDVQIGRGLYRRDIETLQRCRQADEWPAYGDDILPLELPRWARLQAAESITSDY